MTAGNDNVNQVIVILLRTGMTVGSVIALVLDNVIPGKLTGLHLQCMFFITQYPFAKKPHASETNVGCYGGSGIAIE